MRFVLMSLPHEPYPFFLLVGIAALPLLFAWAESRLSLRSVGRYCLWGCVSLAGYVLAAGALYGPARRFNELFADPLGGFKYVLGGLFVGAVLLRFLKSFLRMRAEKDEPTLRRWLFRATLVVLLLFSLWYKVKLFYGDEPLYLMQTASLVENGDLILDDDFRRGAYREFLHLTMEDRKFLKGWSVDIDAPPRQTKYYFGVSFFLTPFYATARVLGFSPYVLRVFVGLPLLLLAALGIARVAGWLSRETEDARLGLWVPFLFCGATPLHVWSQTFSPEPILLFLFSYAVVELLETNTRRWGWTTSALVALPWLHPRVVYVLPVLGLWVLATRPWALGFTCVAAGAASLALRIYVALRMGLGVSGGYSDDVTYHISTLAQFVPIFLSHWIDADAGFLFFAPAVLVVAFALVDRWRKKQALPSVWPWLCLAVHFAFFGIHSTARHVNGIARFSYWWLPAGLAMALSVGEIRRGWAVVGIGVGLFWNFFLSTFTPIYTHLPSASLRKYTGLEFAWFAPQLGRRPDLLMPRPAWVETMLAAFWILVLYILYRKSWSPRWRGEGASTTNHTDKRGLSSKGAGAA